MSPPRSRRWLLVGAGTAAAAAGAALSWWRLAPREAQPGAVDGLWALRFARPQGGDLAMAPLRGRPLLINFWATWCPPCVKEFPELDRFAAAHGQKVRVIGLAIDRLPAVQEFLTRHPVRFDIGLAAMAGTELGRSLGNEAGVLPYTVLLDADGNVVKRKAGQSTYEELVGWLKLV
jgi:thiol-disulfide isomerase/thioredoxin